MEKKPDSAHSRPGFPATVTGLLSTPIIWAIYFVLIYSLQGIACAGGLEGSVAGIGTLTLNIVAATVIALAGQAILGFWMYRAWQSLQRNAELKSSEPLMRASFLALVGWLNAILFFVATVWIGIPALMLDPCA